ncbi:MAG: DivIVA domain-containing protein [Firmicutes bacterium]|nr:DivIVA domain-containing protein [Bacillota bacterium]
MFTPVDLETMVFRRGFRGYKTKEVQEFMRKLIVDYEKLYKENIDLREELEAQKDLLKNYKQMEETLKNTLYLAQGTAEEIKAAGEKQAEVILREAQNRAEQMRLKVREEIQTELQELANLKQQVDLFRIQFTRFLQALIEMAEQHLDIEGIWEKMANLSRHDVAGKDRVTSDLTGQDVPKDMVGDGASKDVNVEDILDPDITAKIEELKKIELTGPLKLEKDPAALAAAKAKAASLFETTEQ